MSQLQAQLVMASRIRSCTECLLPTWIII